MKILRIIGINLLLLFGLIELASYAYFKLGLSIAQYQPSYLSGASLSEEQWMTEDKPWGAWHKNNGKAFKELKCFSIDLFSNSYGARDIERKVASDQPRTVVLGDSFVEGFGVNAEARFTNRLEKQGERAFLNFGASGGFGPVQYQIIYKELASTFDHDDVLIMLLPDNDFRDNDAGYWAEANASGRAMRYRPYWQPKADGEGFETVYFAPKPEGEVTFEDYRVRGSGSPSLKNTIQRMTWVYGVYREIRYFTQHSTLKAGVYSGYFDYTEEQLQATLHYLEEIVKQAEGKSVRLVTIPRLSDFARLETQASPLMAEFEDFSKRMGIDYFDLAAPMKQASPVLTDLFLSCDGHWSPRGHEVAGQLIAERFYK